MRTVADIIQVLHAKKIKPSEEELRHLPFKDAFVYSRLSSHTQVKESHESMKLRNWLGWQSRTVISRP